MPHVDVDSLSRYPVSMTIHSEFLAQLMVAQKDPRMQMVMDDKPFTIVGKLVCEFRNGRNLLVISYKMQNKVIRNAHDIGHFGIPKTEALMQRDSKVI